jgi:hypothetical protein
MHGFSTAMKILPLFLLLFVTRQCAAVGLAPGLYCGLETCYDVLEIDRGEFNRTDLAKIYRRLARFAFLDKIV